MSDTEQAVKHHNLMTLGRGRFGTMTANVADPSSYQYARHDAYGLQRAVGH